MDITEWDCLDNLIKIFNNDYENVDLNKVIIKDVRPRLEKLDKKNERKFKPLYCPEIKNVMFNPPATIVWFEDGSKTTAVAGHGDKYDKEVGLATCMLKRVLGNQTYREIMDKWCYTADKEMLN
jgi:hypothetical protein